MSDEFSTLEVIPVKKGFILRWVHPDKGFGRFKFTEERVDTEAMSPEFVARAITQAYNKGLLATHSGGDTGENAFKHSTGND